MMKIFFMLNIYDRIILPNGIFDEKKPNSIFILLNNVKRNIILECIGANLNNKSIYNDNTNDFLEHRLIQKIIEAIEHESIHLWLFNNISKEACRKYDIIYDKIKVGEL